MSTGPTASSTPTQEDRLHLSDDLLDRHTHNLVPHGDYALTIASLSNANLDRLNQLYAGHTSKVRKYCPKRQTVLTWHLSAESRGRHLLCSADVGARPRLPEAVLSPPPTRVSVILPLPPPGGQGTSPARATHSPVAGDCWTQPAAQSPESKLHLQMGAPLLLALQRDLRLLVSLRDPFLLTAF